MNGNSVKDNYSVSYVEGILEITPRPVKVVTATDSKMYDGTALTALVWSLAPDTPNDLVSGHELVYDVNNFTGTQTNAGYSDNTYDGHVAIYAGSENVTENYDITELYGTLTVTKRRIDVTTKNAEKMYDGAELTCPIWYITENTPNPLVNGHELRYVAANFTGTQTNAGSSTNTYDGHVEIYCGSELVTENYDVNELYGILTVTKRPISVTTGSDQKVYDGNALTNHTWGFTLDTPNLLVYGHELRYDVSKFTGSQTNVGSSENTYDGHVEVYSGSESVTANYEIAEYVGTLTVTVRTITVTTKSDSKIYNGTPLWNRDLVSCENIVTGHTFVITDSTSITNVSESGAHNSVISYDIFDSSDNSVKDNYSVNYVEGTLEITPCHITVYVGDESKMYDGTPLFSTEVDSVSNIISGHSFIIIESTRIINVSDSGTANSVISYNIVDSNGISVKDNYSVTYTDGILTITPRPIKVITESYEKIYDGTALVRPIWLLAPDTENGLVDSHELFYSPNRFTGTQTNVGRSDNTYDGEVEVRFGTQDVTGNYAITKTFGTLTVKKRPITVITGSAEKIFDGLALTEKTWSVDESTQYQLVDGHELRYDVSKFTGSQTNVGSGTNTYDGHVEIYCGTECLTGNYDVTELYGTLTVTKRLITVITETGSKVYDATPLKSPVWSLYRDTIHPLADGHELRYDVSKFTGSRTDVGSSENTYDGHVDVYFLGVRVTDNYEITELYGTLIVVERTITVTTKSDSKMYNGAPLVNSETEEVDNIVSGHTFVILDSTGITNVSESGTLNSVISYDIVDLNGNSVKHNYTVGYREGTLTVTPRIIKATTGSAEKMYDGTPLTAHVWELATDSPNSLVGGHEFGYDVNKFTGSRTDAGSSINTYNGNVEVYYGSENVTGNYNITEVYGTLTVSGFSIKLTTSDAQRPYDGTPLMAHTFEVASDSPNSLPASCELRYDVSKFTASQLKVGNCINLYDGEVEIYCNGENVTGNYDITVVYGTLTVTKRQITVTTASAEKMYDGNPLINRQWQLTDDTQNELVDGHTLKYDVNGFTGMQTDVGSSENRYDGDVRVYIGTEDVTDQYEITELIGTLKVNKRSIVVTTKSDYKYYDGTALTAPEWLLDESNENPLLVGHEIRYEVSKFTASQLEIGRSINTYDGHVAIYAGTENVTDKYEITELNGTLTVRGTVTVQTPDAIKTYDATPLYNYEITVSGLGAGHSYEVINYTTVTDVDSVVNNVSIIIFKMSSGEILTDCYDITYEKGTLTVNPREITVTTNSASKTYDGTALYDNYITVSNLVSGHSFHAIDIVSIVNVSSVENEILSYEIVDAFGTDVRDNYSVTFVNGTLTVTKRQIDVVTASGDKVYDGTPLTIHEWNLAIDTPNNLVYGHELVYDTNNFTGSQTEVGFSGNTYDGLVAIYAGTDNVTSNYEIRQYNGHLVVKPRSITAISENATKIYDGNPLVHHVAKLSTDVGDGLLSGHVVEFEFTGTITEVGQTNNSFTVKIMSGEDDVSDCYTVTYLTGMLSVLDRIVGTNTSIGLDPDYDPDAAKNHPVFYITSDGNGFVYLKTQSYGDFNGGGFIPADEYSLLFNGQYSASYILSLILTDKEYASKNMTIEPVDNIYALPYYTLFGNQISDVYVGGDAASQYILSYFPLDYYTLISGYNIEGLSEFEEAYREFVKSNYLYIDNVTLEYMQSIIEAEGLVATDVDIINKVARYIKQSASYSLDYDRSLDREDNIVVSFLRDYDEGICQHYAAAATMLFRALGIPARYTVGYMAEANAGERVKVSAFNAHAWVEVYLDGMGWVKVEVTGTTKEKIVIKPVNVSKEIHDLDGTTLYAGTDIEFDTVLDKLLDLGYTYEIVISGEQVGIGKSFSTVESFVLYDPDGTPVTNLYNVEYRQGNIEIVGGYVEIYLYEHHLEYDGVAHSSGIDEYFVINEFPNIELVINSINISRKNVGTINSYRINQNISDFIDYTILVDGVDCTDEYGLKVADWRTGNDYDVISISKRRIEIVTGSASKAYDGTPLTARWCNVIGYFPAQHTIQVEYLAEQTEVGIVKNNIKVSSLKILDENLEDVSSNYDYYSIDEDGNYKYYLTLGTLQVY